MKKILVCSPREPAPENATVINTTSRSKDWGRVFSPFINHPVELYGLKAHNVENIYQGLKAYEEHLADPPGWLKWRDALLNNPRAERYPAGKGRKPLFAYINKELGRLDYIQGRKLIYIPAYIQKLDRYCGAAVEKLISLANETDIWLWDFDVYSGDFTFDELLHNKDRNMGHAFVLRQYLLDKVNGTDEVMRYRL